MLGHKRIPSREGGIEIVVEELATRMVKLGHNVTCYNRKGHHVSGKEFDCDQLTDYKGVRLKSVFTLNKKGLAAMTASVAGRFARLSVSTMWCIFMLKDHVLCYGFLNCSERNV